MVNLEGDRENWGLWGGLSFDARRTPRTATDSARLEMMKRFGIPPEDTLGWYKEKKKIKIKKEVSLIDTLAMKYGFYKNSANPPPLIYDTLEIMQATFNNKKVKPYDGIFVNSRHYDKFYSDGQTIVFEGVLSDYAIIRLFYIYYIHFKSKKPKNVTKIKIKDAQGNEMDTYRDLSPPKVQEYNRNKRLYKKNALKYKQGASKLLLPLDEGRSVPDTFTPYRGTWLSHFNQLESVKILNKCFRKWLRQVKKLGLAKARALDISPFENCPCGFVVEWNTKEE